MMNCWFLTAEICWKLIAEFCWKILAVYKYSITGDHHNRMVHNYIERISSYSPCSYPIGFFTYIAGGFISSIDHQIKSEADESGVHGSGITVSNFIKMIELSQRKPYSHRQLRQIFGLNRQVLLKDINREACRFEPSSVDGLAAEGDPQYGDK